MHKIFILLISINTIYGTFFLNKYWVPELVNDQRNLRVTDSTSIKIQPFIMHTNEANPTKNIQNQYVYELDGFLSLANLEYNNILNNNMSITIPSEWIANDYHIPLRLNGNLYAKGIAWNITHAFLPWLTIGWSSGIGPMTGAMNIQPSEEPEKYRLKESILIQSIDLYKTLSMNLGFVKNHTNFINFADQDIYIAFCFDRDYFCYMRKIKFTGKLGGIVPTSHTVDINNPADIPGGLNGFSAIYSGLYIDLILKEDVFFNFTSKFIYLFPQEKTIRLRNWTESLRFGGKLAPTSITPGIIYNFSPVLRIDGLRHGLGIEVNYSVWGQNTTAYSFHGNLDIPEYIKINMESVSTWNQEHCNITLFYDFTREASIDPYCKKILSFSADIPVHFFFSNNSGRSLGISLLFESDF